MRFQKNRLTVRKYQMMFQGLLLFPGLKEIIDHLQPGRQLAEYLPIMFAQRLLSAEF